MRFTLTILLFGIALTLHAQIDHMMGIWGITKVTVNEDEMTPVAKWMKLTPDHSFTSGNGWLQSSKGSWTYESFNQTLTLEDTLDIRDNYGPFTVQVEEDLMYWRRIEDGAEVTVHLSRRDDLPMSPADYLEGVWQEIDVNTSPSDDTKKVFERIFFRWDRIYVCHSPNRDRTTGYWHINGHRPIITLMPHDTKHPAESWTIEVDAHALIMKGASDSNKDKIRVFTRTNAL